MAQNGVGEEEGCPPSSPLRWSTARVVQLLKTVRIFSSQLEDATGAKVTAFWNSVTASLNKVIIMAVLLRK